MSYFFKNKYVVGLIFITVVIFVFMGMSTVERPKANVVENALGNIISPIQKFIYNIGESIENTFHFFREIKTLKEQNEELSVKLDQLEHENRSIQELKEENRRLREMLELKERMEQFDMVGAEIVSKNPGNWFHTFIIDKGTAHGLKKECAVITTKGLVGYINDIGTNWASVITIIDSNSSVASHVVRTQDITIVKGDLTLQDQGLCKMTYISKGSDIIAGDVIETSGMGGIYPKGLLVGKVKEIKPEAHGISQYAIIEPAVNFERLNEVFVIRNTNYLISE